MRTQTRRGLKVTLNPKQFVRQERIELGHETYYVVYRADGTCVELNEQLLGLEYTTLDKRPKPTILPTPQPIVIATSTLPKAEDCPSANEGKWCTAKQTDPHAAEKYKGETFYTHKSAPGLVIKRGDQVVHETKMSDMYKRRD